jgi:hypothetical protein
MWMSGRGHLSLEFPNFVFGRFPRSSVPRDRTSEPPKMTERTRAEGVVRRKYYLAYLCLGLALDEDLYGMGADER